MTKLTLGIEPAKTTMLAKSVKSVKTAISTPSKQNQPQILNLKSQI